MKRNMRCPACGRRRKPSHEKRCGTQKAYSTDCQRYEDFDMQKYKLLLAQRLMDALKETEALVNKFKKEEINGVETEAKATEAIGEPVPNAAEEAKS